MCAVDCVAAALCAIGLLVESRDRSNWVGALGCHGLWAVGAGVGRRLVFAVVRVVEAGSGGGCDAIGLVLLAVCRQEYNSNLLLLDRRLGGALNAGPDLRNSEAWGSVGGDGDGLDKELVFAAGVERRVLLHGLEKHLDLDIAGGLDAARVGSYAVSGRRSVRSGWAKDGCRGGRTAWER